MFTLAPPYIGCGAIRVAVVAVAFGLGALCAPSPLVAADELRWVKQKSITDCGRAVLASLVAMLSNDDPERVYQRISNPADMTKGYSPPELQERGARLDVSLVQVQPSSPFGFIVNGDCKSHDFVDRYFDQLSADLKGGQLAIVPTRLGNAPAHYYLLFAASDKSFNALNPARPGVSTFSRTQLQHMMCAFGYLALMPDSQARSTGDVP